MRVMVTGAAGFIGFHSVKKLLELGHEVLGVDNLNDYYDVRLKKARLSLLERHSGFTFDKIDIADAEALTDSFRSASPERVLHLAAQAGVRYSISNPSAYVSSNLVGFANILELCRSAEIEHLVYASSSSVYGANTDVPFAVQNGTNHPISLYAATKKSNELMAHAYSHLFGLPTTGLRFFTVYGPWGRPDMAYFSFAQAILDGRPIDVFNNGEMRRDFTYIDDVVAAVVAALEHKPTANPEWKAAGTNPDPGLSSAPYRLYNIGNDKPVTLTHFIDVLERCLGRTAEKHYLPLQPGDVLETHADIGDAIRDFGYRPETTIEDGLPLFAEWLLEWRARPQWNG